MRRWIHPLTLFVMLLFVAAQTSCDMRWTKPQRPPVPVPSPAPAAVEEPAELPPVSSTVTARPRATLRGHTGDVRWVALTDDQGIGFLAVGMPLLSISANHYLNEDFENGPEKEQRHATDLVKRDLITWNLDYKQMGVGGDDSWGARPLDKYMLFPKGYVYKFRLRPISKDEDNPMTLSRQKF